MQDDHRRTAATIGLTAIVFHRGPLSKDKHLSLVFAVQRKYQDLGEIGYRNQEAPANEVPP